MSRGLFLPLAVGLDARAGGTGSCRRGCWSPEDACCTHVTGAGLSGWWLPQLPELVPVFAATRREENRPRRAGVSCARLDAPLRAQVRHGPPGDAPEEVLLRAARDLWLLDLVDLADGRSESAWETMLRLFHEFVGIPVEPQAKLFDENGNFVARVDLLMHDQWSRTA